MIFEQQSDIIEKDTTNTKARKAIGMRKVGFLVVLQIVNSGSRWCYTSRRSRQFYVYLYFYYNDNMLYSLIFFTLNQSVRRYTIQAALKDKFGPAGANFDKQDWKLVLGVLQMLNLHFNLTPCRHIMRQQPDENAFTTRLSHHCGQTHEPHSTHALSKSIKDLRFEIEQATHYYMMLGFAGKNGWTWNKWMYFLLETQKTKVYQLL